MGYKLSQAAIDRRLRTISIGSGRLGEVLAGTSKIIGIPKDIEVTRMGMMAHDKTGRPLDEPSVMIEIASEVFDKLKPDQDGGPPLMITIVGIV